jgi:hypothetical protein
MFYSLPLAGPYVLCLVSLLVFQLIHQKGPVILLKSPSDLGSGSYGQWTSHGLGLIHLGVTQAGTA